MLELSFGQMNDLYNDLIEIIELEAEEQEKQIEEAKSGKSE